MSVEDMPPEPAFTPLPLPPRPSTDIGGFTPRDRAQDGIDPVKFLVFLSFLSGVIVGMFIMAFLMTTVFGLF